MYSLTPAFARIIFTIWKPQNKQKIDFGKVWLNLRTNRKIEFYSNPSKYTSLRAAEKVVHFKFVHIEIAYT